MSNALVDNDARIAELAHMLEVERRTKAAEKAQEEAYRVAFWNTYNEQLAKATPFGGGARRVTGHGPGMYSHT